MHIPITRRIHSIVDELLVHCHRGCKFRPLHPTLFFSILYFHQFIILFIDIIHNHFQTIGLLNIALKAASNAYTFESMHSVASRICVFVFDNVPFDGHFV